MRPLATTLSSIIHWFSVKSPLFKVKNTLTGKDVALIVANLTKAIIKRIYTFSLRTRLCDVKACWAASGQNHSLLMLWWIRGGVLLGLQPKGNKQRICDISSGLAFSDMNGLDKLG